MNIAVIATAFSGYGTLAIYNQFLSELENHPSEDVYHVFIADWMPQPQIDNVFYHICLKRKGIHRVWFDLYGFKRLSKILNVKFDVVVSLQNVPVSYYKYARNIVYFQQALTLYKYHISLNDSFAKTYFLYHYVYRAYIKMMLRHADFVAVQTNVIKNLFLRKFNYSQEKVGVYFPETEHSIDIYEKSTKIDPNMYNFIYPGTANAYKEHVTLIEAAIRIKERNPELFSKIRIHFTVNKEDNLKLSNAISSKGLDECFCFHGIMPHDELMKLYDGCRALLFPSVIETIGLPLLEAASLGLPVVANNIDFVREVLNGYEGVRFVETHDFEEWARQVLELTYAEKRYSRYKNDNNKAWERFLYLIKMGRIIEQ